MIDTHAHLYIDEFENDINEVIVRAKEVGVLRFYLPAIDSGTHDKMIALEDKYPGECFAMMGLHPCSVKGDHKKELEIVKTWLEKRRFVAIGEIGLDFYWDKTFTGQQYESFHQQIEWALQHKLPIVIHSRNATQECIEVVAQYTSKGLRGIFHCFGGTHAEAEAIIDCGFLLGIGGVVTYKNSGLAEVINKVSLKHIVLETDSPYLTPVPFRGKRNESSYLKYIAEKISTVMEVDLGELSKVTSDNALRLFHGQNPNG